MHQGLVIEQPQLMFDPEEHAYYWRGVLVPSVTQIIQSAGLYPPYAKTGKDVLGTAIHEVLASHDRGESPQVSGVEAAHLEAWKEAMRELGVERWDAIEAPSYSRQFRYAGTIDRAACVDGVRILAEIKTGREHPAHRLQTAAYAALVWPDDPTGVIRACVYLEPMRHRIVYHKDFRLDFRGFLGALTVYAWKSAVSREEANGRGVTED